MTIRIEKKYIAIPVNHLATSKKLCLYENPEADPRLVLALDCKIDLLHPQYTVYVDVSRFLGRTLSLDTVPHVDLIPEQCDERALEGLYREPYRPQIHFTTALGWTNDPNGLIRHRGVYHLFYQYNPCGTEWGNMHWGHATSHDLFHWEEQDVALFPDEMGTMYSGSAIEDIHNVTGLQEGEHAPMLLFYTAAGDKSLLSEGKKRTQCLAYSNDGGKTFQKYRGNPVIGHVIHHNRDPKIVWVEELQKYLIALYLVGDRYGLFTSHNMLDWTPIGEISIQNETECPDLFRFEVEGKGYWVLMGASDRYLVGEFREGAFHPITREQQLNYSTCSYAAQSFSGMEDGRVIRMAWHRLNMPCLRAPHQMSIPTEMRLTVRGAECFLTAAPAEEIQRLYTESTALSNKILEQPLRLELAPAAYDLQLTAECEEPMQLELFGNVLEIDPREHVLTLGRAGMPLSEETGAVDLRIVLDCCSMEVFANGGRYCATFPAVCDFNLPYLKLSAKAPIALHSLSCHRLASVHEETKK